MKKRINLPSIKGPDGMKWRLSSDGQFDVRSYYVAIRGTRAVTFSLKCIWWAQASKRVASFVWTAAWGKVLIVDSLVKRGITLVI